MELTEGVFAIGMDDFGAGLYWFEDPIEKRAEGLVSEFVPGSDYRRHKLNIVRVEKVMPTTFSGYVHNPTLGDFGGLRKRLERAFVLDVRSSLHEAQEFRKQILGIGARADKQIGDETKDYIAAVQRRVRDEVMEKLRTLLPHVWEGDAA